VIAPQHKREVTVRKSIVNSVVKLPVCGVHLLETDHVAEAHAVRRRDYIALVTDGIAHPAEILPDSGIADGKRPHGDAFLRGSEVDLNPDQIYVFFRVKVMH